MNLFRLFAAALLSAAVSLYAPLSASGQAKSKTKAAPEPAQTDPYAEVQPATETLDLAMYQRIRDEGLNHSHVMEFASALMDGIGPRLTGSPNAKKANEWTRDTLTKIGLENAHLEDWGEFGLGWQQLNTWARMTSPDTAVLIVQATPWSPSTSGPITAEVTYVKIDDDKDFDQYKGKLAGKIVLFGAMRDVPPLDKALFERYTDKELEDLAAFPVSANAAGLSPEMQARIRAYIERGHRIDKIAKFFADEKVAAVIEPSRDGGRGGGSGGTFFDDNGATLGRTPYLADKKVEIPVIVAAIESYGRLYRLTQAHVPTSVELDVQTKFTGDHEHGFDTVAEIPGTDPKLKEQVVMVGGHLDSWIAGTGATDNGAGTVVAMEAVRILKALGVKPRRTIRIALWTGEEQGLFGSKGYCSIHYGSAKTSTAPDQLALPEFMRRAAGPLEVKPEQKLISGYFNVDNGSGKIRGVYTQGNSGIAPIFAQWIAPLRDLGVTTITNRNTGGTDHLSFDAVGIPGFQFIQDDLDYETRTHHSNMDTYERLQAADLKQIATVEAIFLYNAAQRDQMLPRKPLPNPEQEQKLREPLEGIFPNAVPPPPDEKKQ
ncbi:M20/M25/M40 family metallo-hydrolase [Occallatibacter riparius]|uniref:Carboxypeptidase Q n=1 Tax=Occallatibacter riparius TaxID=1002689 RepID=A0A9J7BU89_9BACT|nr:M20/M25/M40 family metallo-hydrolase [Occallatibacter riparius]UWZ84557.1 M20/M25/M40 family metallo-hydrolase [Occallatibacter riparius]